ncbi:hypothetical protein LHYA1_G002583 [Lachnellula hyalina]|uniref:DH domain-containing protein n=1 Tax=Lachnellula hyalina TaxID=1316788 RepID=A0A8H8R7W0_9HELO|nr:uncharacterized protein LHYA1_G002583 [Lachnellula hyalina]TVY30065.1 hypothetical protein LHYA1_G002583 [Lachnellula hyalina]
MASSPKANPPEEDPGLSTPTKRIRSANNTPRRTLAGNATTTPTPKASAQNKTRAPTSAPARARAGIKKAEPTLLGDFLLGRPSPSRKRRQSLDAVKAEMRVENMDTVQAPGGVKDRVKQWQKANAAEIVIDPLAAASSEAGNNDVWENDDGSDEEERVRLQLRERKRSTGRRRSKEGPEGGVKKVSVAAPKKRVISDSHWMKEKRRSPPGKGAPIPKNFLQATAVNPPLSTKIQDWVKRTESDEPEPEKPRDKPRSRRVSRQDVSDDGGRLKPSRTATPDGGVHARHSPANSFDDGIRVRPLKHDDQSLAPSSGDGNDDGIRIRPSKRRPKDADPSRDSPQDDGIRITPSKSTRDDGRREKSKSSERIYLDDGIRIKPSRENSVDDSIRIKPIRRSGKNAPPDDESSDIQTPTRKKSQKNLRVPSESKGRRVPSSRATSDHGEDDRSSWVTPSPAENSKRRQRKSSRTPPESLDEVPFGDSAFSVLELPLGAEAGTMKRPPPKRTSSFAVPKALKKVFNEGMNIARDTVEPPRGGTNQPPSIESWLKGTQDPFVDRSGETKLDIPAPSPTRNPSFKEDDQSEKDLTAQRDAERSESKRKRRVRSVPEREETILEEEKPPLENRKTRDNLPSMENSPPISPIGLKRTPATRNVTSPKTGRKIPFIEAFRGESSTRPKSVSNPFVDIIGLRERDINSATSSPPDFKSNREPSLVSEDTPRKSSPRHEQPPLEETKREKPLPQISRRTPPNFGGHRLSTIASVETFSTSSSATGTGSELSQTTVTQATVLTAPTSSSLSRNSHKSKSSGLKRRLTKHSDLVSVLSLPDVVGPESTTSIKSARSIRTTRTKIETATVYDLMRELAEDEAKYIRELNTLVDGVIPVLLTCVLSKSDSAIASGLFDPHSDGSTTDPSFTKPIIDMGVALEKLKKLHKRTPLVDPVAFLNWALSAHQTYSEYLGAWRAGFNDVVVNLAPASPSQSGDEQTDMEALPRDKNGDVLGANGQRADVSYFLKRPLVRVKYLEKVIKGLDALTPTEKSQNAKERFHDLLQASRRRHKEENARLEDNRANNTDTTKARDLKTLALAEKTTIDRTRQVQARDLFLLDLPHTSGNRITSHVEVFFRDKSGGDSGDVLVCETHNSKPFLLFPPITKENISARSGDKPGQLVVLIRGQGKDEWSEVLTLDAEEPEAAPEWIEMLGTEPVPPIMRSDAEITDHVTSVVSLVPSKGGFLMSGALDTDNLQIPIGEKVRRDAEESVTPREGRRRVSRRTPPVDVPEPIVEESIVDEKLKDLNDAMSKAGSLGTPKRARAARYHGKPSSPRPTTPQRPSTPDSQTTPTPSDPQRPTSSSGATFNLPYIPKRRSSSTPTTPEGPSTPLKESTSPELDSVKQRSQSALSTRDDGAPPPPAHKRPLSPSTLKNVPILDAPTPKSLNRRSSSPLKHEYQPSVESGASDSDSSSVESDSDSDSYVSSEDDELEIQDVPTTTPIYPQRLSPKGSIYSLQNSTIAPSQSASQAPYQGPIITSSADDVEKFTVVGCSYWNDKGSWVDLYAEPCSLHIGPGWLKAFELATTESSSKSEKPLIVQVLTPIVTLTGHTLDIQVRSPLTADSKLHCKSAHIRYRMLTPTDTSRIYTALKESRMNNMFYNAMQEERRVSGFGSNAYEAAIKGKGRNFLGLRRKQSYRATARAPSEMASESARSSASAMSALRNRLSGSSIFNIKKSSVDITGSGSGSRSGENSGSASTYSSASGVTPPRTPTSFFSSSNQANIDLGSEDIKIRLYERVRHDWDDKKYAYLTVTPPEGRRQHSTLHNGLEKRILVTLRPHAHKDGPGKAIIDEVLGSRCFQQMGIKGVMCTIWQDIRGPNGELGMIGATGGVSGRTQKWLFQAKMGAHASQILGLVQSGGG